MRAALRRVIQLVVVLLFVSFFSFALAAPRAGRPGRRDRRVRVARAAGGRSATSCTSTGRSSCSTALAERRSARQPRQPVLRADRARGKVSTALGQALPVSLQLMALRDDPHDPDRDPARRARGVPVGHASPTRSSTSARSGRSPCPTSHSR